MKKFITLVIALVLTLSLVACSSSFDENLSDVSSNGNSSDVSLDENSSDVLLPSDNQIDLNSTFKKEQSNSNQETILTTTDGCALGHDWGNPTCVTPRSCIVCFEIDPKSKPLGHSFVQGVCEICGDNDPNYIPTLTASKTNVNLNNANESDIIYFTLPSGYTVVYDIDNTNIVNCEWGDWDGDTTSLTFYPVSSGETYVTVSVEGYDVSIVIEVSVKMQYSTLTIVGVGEEYTTYYTGLSEAWCFLHSAEYKQNDYPNDDSVYFEIEVIAELLGDNCYGNDDYGIRYELFRDDVCVKSGNVWFDARYYNQKSANTFNYMGKAGNYTLKFKDLYT